MLHYTMFKGRSRLHKNDSLVHVKKRGTDYETRTEQTIFTLDTEASSLFDLGKGFQPFDYHKKPDDYETAEKLSVTYIWMFGINDIVYYGRTLEELDIFMDTVHKAYPNRKICYVHNLSYDFEQAINQSLDFDTKDVLARAAHKPIRAICARYNMEFRCSYLLTNMSLATCCERYNLPVQKKVGDLDYNVARTPLTPLTEKELGYCEYDIKCLYHLIKKFVERFEWIEDIPYTSTGIIRQEVKKTLTKETKKKIKGMYPSFAVFERLQAAFSGGYTHANASLVGRVLSNVKSYDFASDYPHKMATCKFPMTAFKPVMLSSMDDVTEDKAYLLHIVLHNVATRKAWTYIQKAKCLGIQSEDIIDNGRVAYASKIETTITEQDWFIIRENYNFDYDNVEIIDAYEADKDYLPKEFVELILKQYGIKTSFKDVEGKDAEYKQSKEFINGLYGMCVTNVIRADVEYSAGNWKVLDFDDVDKSEKLAKEYRHTFLNYAWGVWVTAYARRAIWRAISDIDTDAVYVDTDSIKIINNHEEYFEQYNARIMSEMKEAAERLGIDFNDYQPMDPKGKRHPLGVFENDADYLEFITYGAKKYCDKKIKKGKEVIEVTVAGLSKKEAVKELETVADFKPGKVWGYKTSGRTVHFYTKGQSGKVVTGIDGQSFTVTQDKGICIMPTTYELGLTEEYEAYVFNETNRKHSRDMNDAAYFS